ncbi:hypothetical protein THTE_1674 [Thermogutta terrifontis]|uniref:Uncharacterized protein n=1 Tax=Thermogutta terrifontis TaxID=1331910 RepID=A0A286RE95_9BACT|nr:hypothetical protein THTE_1674 [Thermogutta terrifontis]
MRFCNGSGATSDSLPGTDERLYNSVSRIALRGFHAVFAKQANQVA